MKNLIVLIFLVLVNINFSLSQTVSESVFRIIEYMAFVNEVHCSGTGITGKETNQYYKFTKLCELATDEELIFFTDYPNSVVRCYSFQALCARKTVDPFPILLKHLSDNEKVRIFCGCEKDTKRVGDYFLQISTPNMVGNQQFNLSAEQRTIVDSILIFGDSVKLISRDRVIAKLKPESKYYERLKFLAINENNEEALVALAKFNNQNDIPIINKFLKSEKTERKAIQAVREFPDSSFYPILVKVFNKEWGKRYYDYPKWAMIYQALAKYPNKKTFKLFNKTTKVLGNFKYQTLCTFLSVAITKYPNPFFEPLKVKIKLDSFSQSNISLYLDHGE